MSSPKLRLSVSGLALALLGLLVAGPAEAHAHLQSEVPAADSSSFSPQELRLKFSEAIELKFTTVKLTGPGKAAVKTSKPSLAPDDDTTLIVPLPTGLTPGVYLVDWHATATDTHKTQGNYHFTVTP